MQAKTFGNRAPLLWLVLPFALGLVVGKLSAGPLPVGWLLGAAAVAVVAAWIPTTRGATGLVLVTAALTLAGAAYYELRRDRLADWESLPVREARLAVRVDRVFAGLREEDALSGVGRIVAAEPHLAELVGQRVQLGLRFDPAAGSPARGAVVAATGVLQPLPRRPPAGDDFGRYLVDAGVNFRFTRGRLERLIEPPSPLLRALDDLRRRCAGWLGRGLEHRPELVAPLRAMLLGERHELSDEQKARFLASGTMHLFAISGLHIGAIAGCLHTLLRGARLPRRAAFVLGTVLLWGYVQMVGAPPSAVRAFLMVTCVHAAFVWRAPGNALAGLAASALLALLIDPMQLFGAGFQMSYGVVTMLLLLGLPLADAWQARWQPWRDLPPVSWRPWQRRTAAAWRWLLIATGLGVAATLVGSISGVAFFGVLATGSLPANLIMIPAAGGVILAGFCSLLLHATGLAPLGLLMNHAAALLLWLMDAVLRAFVSTPGLHLPAQFYAPWQAGVALAGVLLLGFVGYAGRWRPERGGFWPPVLWIALVLVLAVNFG